MSRLGRRPDPDTCGYLDTIAGNTFDLTAHSTGTGIGVEIATGIANATGVVTATGGEIAIGIEIGHIASGGN